MCQNTKTEACSVLDRSGLFKCSPLTADTHLSATRLKLMLLLQFGGWGKERPRQDKGRSSPGVLSGGEESSKEAAGTEEGAPRGLHGQFPRQRGNLPDQDTGRILLQDRNVQSCWREYKYVQETKILCFHRTIWPGTSTTSVSWRSSSPLPSTSSCSSTK